MENIDAIVTKCVSENSRRIYEHKDHVLLGISPFNSYYSENNIRCLLQWASTNFSNFNIFIPDTLPIYTFLALGYETGKAEKKTRRQVSYLQNKIYKSLSYLNYSSEESQKIIINVSSLALNDSYIGLKQRCYDLYHSDIEFQRNCDQCRDFILNGYNINYMSSEKKQIAIRYLLDEMPLFIDSPSILNISASMFVYHQTPDFIDYLYNYMHKNIVSNSQGFLEVVVNVDNRITSDEILC